MNKTVGQCYHSCDRSSHSNATDWKVADNCLPHICEVLIGKDLTKHRDDCIQSLEREQNIVHFGKRAEYQFDAYLSSGVADYIRMKSTEWCEWCESVATPSGNSFKILQFIGSDIASYNKLVHSLSLMTWFDIPGSVRLPKSIFLLSFAAFFII